MQTAAILGNGVEIKALDGSSDERARKLGKGIGVSRTRGNHEELLEGLVIDAGVDCLTSRMSV